MTISILIADDHGVLRAGLRALLSAEPDLQVVGQAADGYEALTLARQLRPNVVLADINMPGASGIDVAAALRSESDIAVLILTMYEDGNLLDQAIRAGARGYIAKRAVETELIDGVRAVARGDTYIQAELRLLLVSGPERRRPALAGDAGALSEPEKELLAMMARGHTIHEIAETLELDLPSIESLRSSLGSKLGMRSRIELTRFARENGLV